MRGSGVLHCGNAIQFSWQKQEDAPWEWGFYSRKEAARLARVPFTTVSHWSARGIVVPTSKWINEDGKEIEGYSFEGLVYLRLVRLLRKQKFPMRSTVSVVKYLKDVFGPPGPKWEEARIFSHGRDIWVDHKDTWEVTSANRRGQKAAQMLLGPEFALHKKRADALLVPNNYAQCVEINPKIRDGFPVVCKTTIQTETIYRLHQTGLTYHQIGEYYPSLSYVQINRANEFESFLDNESLAM